ncbi:MAG: hypothetical protein LBN00_02120 [Oscillospiraceae bacterium]|nr:hypothetical protein [Oscillospiraceae bacterium]
MKSVKKHSFLLSLIGAAVLIAAIATLIIVFRDEIAYFFESLRDKLYAVKDEILTPEEYDDYADVGGDGE